MKPELGEPPAFAEGSDRDVIEAARIALSHPRRSEVPTLPASTGQALTLHGKPSETIFYLI